MKPGYTVDGGSEDHLIMHEMSQRALKITMELNNKYHTKEEIVQLALPYEILLQHASIVSCLCVFGISQSSLGRIMAQENLTVLTTKIKKEQPIHILELFFYFRRPRSIDITVSCSFVLRLFHILKTSFCFSVRFSELPS